MFEIVDQVESNAIIKVIGVGGGGGNAVNHMLKNAVEGVEFIVANTDAQAMKAIPADRTLQLGGGITKGLGAGANPDVGRNAAMEDRDAIADLLMGTDRSLSLLVWVVEQAPAQPLWWPRLPVTWAF